MVCLRGRTCSESVSGRWGGGTEGEEEKEGRCRADGCHWERALHGCCAGREVKEKCQSDSCHQYARDIYHSTKLLFTCDHHHPPSFPSSLSQLSHRPAEVRIRFSSLLSSRHHSAAPRKKRVDSARPTIDPTTCCQSCCEWLTTRPHHRPTDVSHTHITHPGCSFASPSRSLP